jgi:dipeptidyl aminopeptidase/acylaminoacyl peptidase
MRVVIVVTLLAAVMTSVADALPANGRVAVLSGPFQYGLIYLVEPDGSAATALTSQPALPNVAWSPDGTKVAFTGSNDEFPDVYVINSDGSSLTRITQDEESGFVGWSPDGTRLLLSQMRLADPDGGNVTYLGDGAGYGWSPDGRILFGSQGPFGLPADVWLMNADGTGRVQLTSRPEPEIPGSFSPDGSRLTFYVYSGELSQGTDLWTMNPDGTDQRQVTDTPGHEGAIWSPDGTRILLLSDQDMADYINWIIYSAKPDGTDRRRITTGTNPHWSPDGTKIAFTRYDPTTELGAAYVINADGTGERLVRDTPYDDDIVVGWEPVLNRSPDCSTATAATNLAKKSNLITVTLRGATDPDGDAVALRITGVTQDEPLTGPGDQTRIDALAGATPDEVRVRNESSTKGDGRVYRISFEGDDSRGGSCSGTVKVSVPRKGVAIDSAPPSYNSFGV